MPTTGGSTVFYTQDTKADIAKGAREAREARERVEKKQSKTEPWRPDPMKQLLEVLHRHDNMLLGPFSTTPHEGTEWTGFRCCIGGYVDVRSLRYFHMFDLVDGSGLFKDHTFRQKTKDECARLRHEFEEFKREPLLVRQRTVPLSNRYKERVASIKEAYKSWKDAKMLAELFQ